MYPIFAMPPNDDLKIAGIFDGDLYADKFNVYYHGVNFAGANLDGADFRYVSLYSIGHSPYTDPFSWKPSFAAFGVGLKVGSIDVVYSWFGAQTIPDNTDKFSRGLDTISSLFGGTNWPKAQLPKPVRDWLEHPARLRPSNLGCTPRAPQGQGQVFTPGVSAR
jgi:hypothetical protein